MIEKIKYCFSKVILKKQIQLACIAVITALTTVVVTLLTSSIYTVNIFDGQKTYTVRTLNKNVSSALANVKFASADYEIEKSALDGKTANITIKYTFPVFITRGKETIKVQFSGGTVSDVLKKAGFTPDKYDFVEPSLNTEIKETSYIDFTDVSFVKGESIEEIPFKTVTEYSSKYLKGTVKTLKAGENGSKKVVYTEKLVNGISVKKTVTSEKVIEKSVSAKKVIGTKVVNGAITTSASVEAISWLKPSSPIALDANGNPVNYKKKMTVQATAYTYTGHKCATGVSPKPGYIAVNPKVIPYGTKMYIKTPNGKIIYGYAVAADTGGFIKKRPTGVDLFMTTKSACMQFGRRNVEIYILE